MFVIDTYSTKEKISSQPNERTVILKMYRAIEKISSQPN